MRSLISFLGFALVSAAVPASAQAPVSTETATHPPAAESVATFSEGNSYRYSPDGRRDPFLNLLAAGASSGVPAERADGVAGLMTTELSVRGVVLNKGAYLAMVQGPDNRTYVVQSGDKLMDGMVKSVTAEGLVVLQDVNDPLALVRQREVYRRLRTLEDAKE